MDSKSTQEHVPLQFFIEIIQRNKIELLRSELYNSMFPTGFEPDGNSTYDYDPVTEIYTIESLDYTASPQPAKCKTTVRFKDTIKREVNNGEKFFYDAINWRTENIKEQAPSKLISYIKATIKEIEYLISLTIDNPKFENYDFIVLTLQDMIDQITNRFIKKIKSNPKRINPVDQSQFTKLKWRGPVNQLFTMFYELHKEELFNDAPVLDATENEIKDFIVACFIDQDENLINRDTLNRYTKDPSKLSKTGKKINIKKILSENPSEPTKEK